MKLTKEKIFETAKLLFPLFLEGEKRCLENLKGRSGVYFAILEKEETVDQIMGEVMGNFPAEDLAEKKPYAHEKIMRLKEGPSYHDSSFESENPEEKKFGGGIRAGNFFIGVTGLTPHSEKRFAILVMLTLREITFGQANSINNATKE